MSARKQKRIFAVLGGAMGLVALVLFLLLPRMLPPTDTAQRQARIENADLQIHVIDVGQGDAMLLMTDGGCVLIDTGTNESEDALRAYLNGCGVERIEYMFLSHPHEDHMGGADMVLREYEVGTLVMSDLAPDADVGMQFTTALVESETDVVVPSVGDVYVSDGLSVTVLAPPDGGFESVNDNSLILRVEYGECSVMTTGDAEAEVEAWLLANCDPALLDVDLLKAGHHGSDTSTGADFLAALSPDYVAISCGRGNTYNHPVQSVLDAIVRAGAQVCRTDTDGTLVFLSDGVTLWREK